MREARRRNSGVTMNAGSHQQSAVKDSLEFEVSSCLPLRGIFLRYLGTLLLWYFLQSLIPQSLILQFIVLTKYLLRLLLSKQG